MATHADPNAVSRGSSARLACCLLTAACSSQPAEDTSQCDYKDLAPPATCNGGGDGTLLRACWVDCAGNVYPVSHGSEMQDLPDDRFYGVFLQLAPAASIPARIEAFAGRNTMRAPTPWCCVERDAANELPVEVSNPPGGGTFIRLDRELRGPLQVVVRLVFDASSSYLIRAYAGGEPLLPSAP